MHSVAHCPVNIPFDSEAIQAAFAQPSGDGDFSPDIAAYLGELGQTRPSVVLAFAPKAAGTYLRSAAIEATGGQLVRTTYAPGGSADSFYLPTFLNYYGGGFPSRTLVTHVHMPALPANQRFIAALDLKPVIMLRSIPDMLASYADELEPDPLAPIKWLNTALPDNYPAMTDRRKSDFLIEMMGPWYVSYFASWMDYAAKAPGRVCLLSYDAFLADPAQSLEMLLAHSGLPRTRAACQAALAAVWQDRRSFRYNKGVAGRGKSRFDARQTERLRQRLAFFPQLAPWMEILVPRS
jgi:hypothetical protein